MNQQEGWFTFCLKSYDGREKNRAISSRVKHAVFTSRAFTFSSKIENISSRKSSEI